MKNYKRIANVILLSHCITSLLSCQNNPIQQSGDCGMINRQKNGKKPYL